DEADVLADRKLIISNGTICCLGSSLFLKNAYIMSYSFDIVVEEEKNNEIKEIFNKYIPNIRVTKNTTTNDEKMFTYFIPMANSDLFSKALHEVNGVIEGDVNCKGYTLTSPSLEELFVKLEASKENDNISVKKNAFTEKMRKKYNQDRIGPSDNFKQIWSFIKLRLKLFFRNKVAAINTMFFPLVITAACLIGAKYLKNSTNKPIVVSYGRINISDKLYDGKWFIEYNMDDKGKELLSNLDINNHNEYIGGFLSYVKDNVYNITIYDNVNMMYSTPLSINLLSNAILSKYNSKLKIKTSYQPLDIVYEIFNSSNDKDNLDNQNLTNIIIEFVIVAEIAIMFSLLISLYGPTLVKEREENITQQLYLNGMKNLNYWIGVICSDLLCVLLSILLVTIFEKYDKASTFSSIFNPVSTLILCLVSVYAILKEGDKDMEWKFYLLYILPMIFFAPSAIPT
ncbi:hypothetical protein PIROE2DRAFT_18521, partial [Piromyces sp. E2]